MLADCRFLITCEHASAAIPERWKSLLSPFCAKCEEHQIWDPGTSEIASQLARMLDAPVFKGEYTRLLVDLNRSARHPDLFSPVIRELEETRRTRIATDYYYPFRHQVIRALDYLTTEKRPIVHLSIHSFTPVFKEVTRDADFGLLYNPQHIRERETADLWLYHLRNTRPDLVSRDNYPYLGVTDGHVTSMRLPFGGHGYLGFELEFNQKLSLGDDATSHARWIYQALRRTLNNKHITTLLTRSRK